MNNEIILKKVDNEFVGVIPHLGLIAKSTSAEAIYSELSKKQKLIEEEWGKAGLTHLLKEDSSSIKVIRLEKKLKRFILTSLLAYFLGLVALGLVINNSAKRVIATWGLAFKEQPPERKEKNLQRFKKTLQIYKPYIHELQKVLNEKDSDANR